MGRVLNGNKESKRRKGKRGKGKSKEILLKIFSTNAAGLKLKIQSLKNEINTTNAAIFTVQETHFAKKGKLKVDGFEIFEAIRQKKKDGGTLMGIHKGLKPMLIKEYSDKFELLIVEVTAGDKEIRVISGYGPQENWPEDDRMPFFMALVYLMEYLKDII